MNPSTYTTMLLNGLSVHRPSFTTTKKNKKSQKSVYKRAGPFQSPSTYIYLFRVQVHTSKYTHMYALRTHIGMIFFPFNEEGRQTANAPQISLKHIYIGMLGWWLYIHKSTVGYSLEFRKEGIEKLNLVKSHKLQFQQ